MALKTDYADGVDPWNAAAANAITKTVNAINATALQQDTVLPASMDILVNTGLEVGAYSLEIPATSSLEIYYYNAPVNRAATAFVVTGETTAATGFVDLATTSDQVTVTIGPSGTALLFVAISSAYNDTLNGLASVSVAISGANTRAAIAASPYYLSQQSTADAGGTSVTSLGGAWVLTDLKPGVTTFKLKYSAEAQGGTASFWGRSVSVVPQ